MFYKRHVGILRHNISNTLGGTMKKSKNVTTKIDRRLNNRISYYVNRLKAKFPEKYDGLKKQDWTNSTLEKVLVTEAHKNKIKILG